MAKQTQTMALVALTLVAIGAIFGVQNLTTTATITPTPNSEVTITTSEDRIQAQGQTTQARPNGESSTTVEGTISQDEASVRVERTDKIEFPEIENPLDGIGDSIAELGKTSEAVLDKIGDLNRD